MIENREDFRFDKALACNLVLVQTTQVFHRKCKSKNYNPFDVHMVIGCGDGLYLDLGKGFCFLLGFPSRSYTSLCGKRGDVQSLQEFASFHAAKANCR